MSQKYRPGCPNCGGCDTSDTLIDVTVYDGCAGGAPPLSGATVSVTNGTDTFSGTTDGSGFVSIGVNATGTWTVSGSYANHITATTTVNVSACSTTHTASLTLFVCDSSLWNSNLTLTTGGTVFTMTKTGGSLWNVHWDMPGVSVSGTGLTCTPSTTISIDFSLSCTGTPGCPSLGYAWQWRDCGSGGAHDYRYADSAGSGGSPVTLAVVSSFTNYPLNITFTWSTSSDPTSGLAPPLSGSGTITF